MSKILKYSKYKLYFYMNKNSILKYAEENYPIGTKYMSLVTTGSVCGHKAEAKYKPRYLGHNIEVGYGYIYANGKWAEIIAENRIEINEGMKTHELLAIARKLYPIGTKYLPLTEQGVELLGFNTAYDQPRRFGDGLIDVGVGYIYVNGIWARIQNPVNGRIFTPTIPAIKIQSTINKMPQMSKSLINFSDD